ncbi:MBL fold metallo-hydrolase [Plectonema cf. radiosum LEGE 06105]|uniref:MBL fold metallo-hydrolase n=1 Tax=Plectonema cf. radiosum LEGE 06105 TaxID=945769 RepID=A0A8J7F6E0_9CYAN|nr:MBL fold metallo-hydrolase [Plectonema radiosum]MBE9212754.1 MBL fold metallo-hydrolase [Plectonema cf. radiosum LEGE 06105]
MPNIQPSKHHPDVNESPENFSSEQTDRFLVKFWGVRGLIPTPSRETNVYGGNTACVEMQVGGKILIFDGGTGLRMLGKSWLEKQQEIVVHLFFTNAQTNRIQGFPFFAPAFAPQNYLHIYGTAASNGASIKQSLCDQMLLPHFPYPLQVMQSQLQFYNLTPNQVVAIDDVTVEMGLINHIQKSIGYKITWSEYSVAYITDLQSKIDDSDVEGVIGLTQGVDLLIVNPNYISSDFRSCQTPIDSYWKNAVDLARTTGVKQLVFSNHHPNDHDDFLDRVQAALKSDLEPAFLAREGMVISIN